MGQNLKLAEYEDAERGCEVLNSCEGARIGELHDGPFVDDGEQGGGEAVTKSEPKDLGIAHLGTPCLRLTDVGGKPLYPKSVAG